MDATAPRSNRGPGLGMDPDLVAAARRDVDANLVDGCYFGAGREFGPTIFTRDMALSGVLALNRTHPAAMRASLRLDRTVRFQVGWRVIAGSSAVDIPGLPFVDSGLDFQAFLRTYRTNDFSRRSDDVVWLWAYHDWLLANAPADEGEWAWLLDTGERCFAEYYRHFRDPADGLYRGQACFVDVMMDGYPASPVPEDGRDAAHFRIHHLDDAADEASWRPPGLFPASLRACLLGKAASTNALYLLACRALAEACRRLGRDPSPWEDEAAALRSALRRAFLRRDGGIAWRLDADGRREERQHVLATAWLVLAGALDADEARRALAAYPTRPWGSPLFDPGYAGNPHRYHNRSIWPFADAFLARARWERERDPAELARWLALTARAWDGANGFRELAAEDDGRLLGSPRQLWSAAGYLGAALAAGLAAPATGSGYASRGPGTFGKEPCS